MARFARALWSTHTFYNRYVRWGERGVWRDIFEALAQEDEDALVFIDASIVKAHHAAAGSKRGNWQKVLDAHGEKLIAMGSRAVSNVAQVRFMPM